MSEQTHIEAIAPTVRVLNEVAASVFDDKIKDMGHVKVSKGRIEIKLDYLPGMISDGAQRDFVMRAIRLSLEACWDAMPEAFDPHSQPHPQE